MTHLDLHVLCVAAYNLLGVPDDPDTAPLGSSVFSQADVGSVFWVGINDVYVRGRKRTVQPCSLLGMPVGTIGVVAGVREGVDSIVSVVHLNTCPGMRRIVPNPQTHAVP
jgi:hypothetical protein